MAASHTLLSGQRKQRAQPSRMTYRAVTLQAWLQVAGCLSAGSTPGSCFQAWAQKGLDVLNSRTLISSKGLINAFGVFENYYQMVLPSQTSRHPDTQPDLMDRIHPVFPADLRRRPHWPAVRYQILQTTRIDWFVARRLRLHDDESLYAMLANHADARVPHRS
jgi:hypothetical protein